jgi:hypothetical protein
VHSVGDLTITFVTDCNEGVFFFGEPGVLCVESITHIT